MKLYLVRHGQSEANRDGRFSGWSLVNLTEQGQQDAQRAGTYLAGRHFDHVYASDLPRAIQTAHIALPGCEPELLAELRENNVGLLAGRDKQEMIARYGDDLVQACRVGDFVAYGGEDREMMAKRIRTFLKRVEEAGHETVIAFCHEGILRGALEVVLEMKINRSHMECRNGSIALFSFENGKWMLEGWGLGCE